MSEKEGGNLTGGSKVSGWKTPTGSPSRNGTSNKPQQEGLTDEEMQALLNASMLSVDEQKEVDGQLDNQGVRTVLERILNP